MLLSHCYDMGHLHIVQYFVEQCDSIVTDMFKFSNTTTELTLLMHACHHGYTDIVNSIITTHYSNINTILRTKGPQGNTAIMIACQEGNLDCVKCILSRTGKQISNVLLSETNDLKNTAYMLACIGKHVAIVQFLNLEYAALPEKVLSIKNNSKNTPTMECCKNGWIEIFQATLKTKIPIEKLLLDCNNNLNTPLHFSCMAGHTEMVQLIMKSMFNQGQKLLLKNLVSKNEFGNTPLMEACIRGHLGVVKYVLTNPFIEMGSPKTNTSKFKRKTILMGACENGRTSVVQFIATQFKSCAASLFTMEDQHENIPLMYACSTGQLSTIQYILTRFKENWKKMLMHLNSYKMTPLSKACQNGHLSVVKYLLEDFEPIANDNSPTGKVKYANLALYHACKSGRMELVQYLLTIIPSIPNGLLCCRSLEKPAFMWLCVQGYNQIILYILNEFPEHVDELLSYKCSLYEVTPLMELFQRGNMQVIKYIFTAFPSKGKLWLNQIDRRGNTALFYAGANQRYSIVDFMLSQFREKAVEWIRSGRLVHSLCGPCKGSEQAQFLSKLMQQYPGIAELLNDKDTSGVTPLGLACKHGHWEIVGVLLNTIEVYPEGLIKGGEEPILETSKTVFGECKNVKLFQFLCEKFEYIGLFMLTHVHSYELECKDWLMNQFTVLQQGKSSTQCRIQERIKDCNRFQVRLSQDFSMQNIGDHEKQLYSLFNTKYPTVKDWNRSICTLDEKDGYFVVAYFIERMFALNHFHQFKHIQRLCYSAGLGEKFHTYLFKKKEVRYKLGKLVQVSSTQVRHGLKKQKMTTLPILPVEIARHILEFTLQF